MQSVNSNNNFTENWQKVDSKRLIAGSFFFATVIVQSIIYYRLGIISLVFTILVSIFAAYILKDLVILYFYYRGGIIKSYKILNMGFSNNADQNKNHIYNWMQNNIGANRQQFFGRTFFERIGYNRSFKLKNDPTKQIIITINLKYKNIYVMLSTKATEMKDDFDIIFHDRLDGLLMHFNPAYSPRTK